MLPLTAKEDLLFKAPLTATVVEEFLSSYQSLNHDRRSSSNTPFVYVDQNGVKLVTNVVNAESDNSDGIFALSVANDGWMEMLAFLD